VNSPISIEPKEPGPGPFPVKSSGSDSLPPWPDRVPVRRRRRRDATR